MEEVSSALLTGSPNAIPKLRIHVGFLSSLFVLMRILSGEDRVLRDVVVGVQDVLGGWQTVSTPGSSHLTPRVCIGEIDQWMFRQFSRRWMSAISKERILCRFQID
jgi:hypothetical protein